MLGLTILRHYQSLTTLSRLPLRPRVKNLPASGGEPDLILVGKDPLEKGMARHSSIFAWRIPWTEEPGGL